MRKWILTLTIGILSSTLWALEIHNYRESIGTIGEEKVEIEVVGSSADHYMTTCGPKKGFHVGSERLGISDTYRFTIYCGPAPMGIGSTYIETRETGI